MKTAKHGNGKLRRQHLALSRGEMPLEEHNMQKRTSIARRVKYVRCASITELKRLCGQHARNCKVILQGGVYSAKTIRFNLKTGSFHIINHIDDSTQTVKPQDIAKKTILGDAIAHGCLGVEVGHNEPFCEHRTFKSGVCTTCKTKREPAQLLKTNIRRQT